MYLSFKKHRYLQLYVPSEVEQLVEGAWAEEKFIKKSEFVISKRLEAPRGQSLSRGKRYLGEVQEKC